MTRKNETRRIPSQRNSWHAGHSCMRGTSPRLPAMVPTTIQGLVCVRCGTVKYMKISARTGLRVGSVRYDYVDGYQVTGGSLSVDEIAACRLSEVKSHVRR